jgi:hypothetical protein
MKLLKSFFRLVVLSPLAVGEWVKEFVCGYGTLAPVVGIVFVGILFVIGILTECHLPDIFPPPPPPIIVE